VKIVPRYILREHLGPLLFALSALTSLLLLNFVAKRFGDLVGKGLPWTVIVEFLLLSVPFTVAMTLPMAVLVATLHAFSRFAAENEITAFKASGVSMQVLVRPVILASCVLTLFMVWFNDQVLPRANHRLATLQGDIARVKPTFALSEQVINEVIRGQLYLRAARIDAGTNRMRDVVIYDLSDPANRRTIVADSGRLGFNATGEDLILTLFDGNTAELTPRTPTRLQRNFFTSDLIRVRGVAARLDRDGNRSGYKSDREMGVCELLAKVRATEFEQQDAWRRLQLAQGVAEPAPLKPAPGGLGGFYCAAIDVVRDRFAVKEAEAAPALRSAAQEPQGSAQGPRKPGTPRMPVTEGEAPAQAPERRPAPQPAPQPAPPPAPPTAAAAESTGLLPEEQETAGTISNPVVIEGLETEFRMTRTAIDQYRVEIEKKFAIATACVIFVLLGAPIALRFPRGGVGLTIGVSLAVFGLYYVGLLGGEALADRNLLDPAIAMWGTNLILGVVGLVLTLRLGSEGSTSRGSETAEWWGRLLERVLRRKAA
jgi:lipopolysaccharide export system permease protein